MDKIPGNDPMQKPPQPPLAGLDPADLLRQGAADDTFAGAGAFQPPPLEEMAALFPQFEILELIGKGGMGAVYKVRQKELDRIVALKILPPAIGQSEAFSNRFTREAKALAKLNHPGIVTIHEFGQQDGLYFILMEFVDGVNLAQLMQTGRIAPREALAIVPQICDALQFAHDQGIVHRDIKPENILLDRLGRVKVADFGIAKVIAAACEDPIRSGDIPVPTDSTLAGNLIGTPAYMAPEQIDHPSEVDHRADIYALGVVFYQMLTGELPGKRLEAPSKKVHIDVRLDEIVLQAMEKNPELRFQQVSVMKTRMEDLKSQNKPAEIQVGGKKRSAGSMIAIGCGVVALLGLVAVLVVGVLSWSLFSKSRDEAVARMSQIMDSHAEIEPTVTAPPAGHASTHAETFVDLALEIDAAREIYLEGDPSLVAVENKMKAFIARYPDFPNEESREVAARKQVALLAEINDLATRFGTRHPRIVELTRMMERLAKLPEIGEMQLQNEAAEKILSRDLPQGNRLEIRLVSPDDAGAEVLKIERDASVTQEIRVSQEVIVCDRHIKETGFAQGGEDDNHLNITLNEVGARRVAEATKAGHGTLRLAIMVDGKVESAPVINSQLGRNLQISGKWSSQEYLDLLRSFPSWDAQKNSLEAAYWLIGIDEGKYPESYASSSTIFRERFTEKTWVAMLTHFRKPLGIVTSRGLKKYSEAKAANGTDYRLMLFNTHFSNQQDAVETVAFVKENDGVWRAAGYFIR